MSGDFTVGRVEICRECIASRPPIDWAAVYATYGVTGPVEDPATDIGASYSRWPTLEAIGLGDALDAVERVVSWAQKGKHPGPKWAEQTTAHQLGKMLGHAVKGMKREGPDPDTGEHAYAHTAARALMLLGLVLREANE